MELIDILNEDGVKTGKNATRAEIHNKGYWHEAAHVWLLNSKNEALLQRRSIKKENHPGMWDISAAGHVSTGEDGLTTAIRETEEEIGVRLAPEDLEFIGKVKQSYKRNDGYANNEFDDVYLVKKDVPISDLKMQESEVDEIKYVPITELKRMVGSRNSSLVMHDEEFTLLFRRLGIYTMRIVEGSLMGKSVLDGCPQKVLQKLEESENWGNLIEVELSFEKIKEVQKEMIKHYETPDPWYMDGFLKDDNDVIICAFGADDGEGGKICVFNRNDRDAYEKVLNYGVSKGIPKEEMSFLD
jgi:isopentenyl-diphosphate Delta-isomerase